MIHKKLVEGELRWKGDFSLICLFVTFEYVPMTILSIQKIFLTELRCGDAAKSLCPSPLCLKDEGW